MNTSGYNYIDGYSNQRLEDMYPEVYNRVYPMIRQKAMYMRGQNITHQILDSATNDIMWNCGLKDTDTPDMPSDYDPYAGEAIPAARFGNYYGGYRPPYYGYRRKFSPGDLIKILLLRELI